MSRLIYENPLASEKDVEGWTLEGQAKVSFEDGCMRMENAMSAENGQKANYVFWCDREFPDNIEITWEFKPIREPGLAIMFFAAKGINGEDIFDEKLQKRTGEYPLYHHGDINAFHVSYFRRKEPDERQFHTCNLRKSYGFNLVAQGADPIPDVSDCVDFYRMKLIKKTNRVEFYVNDLMSFAYDDDGETFGKPLKEGKIGLRQLAPMAAVYKNLKVYAL
ncbi:MAG: YesU family protein [Lachnospiraceae bacterium]|nr:YesU family protein [Lachnospiraceae bacterium]